MDPQIQAPRMVIGIPGNWPDRSNLVTRIASESGGYLFAGMVLMHVETGWSCTLEIYDKDPAMRRAFEVAGGGRFSEEKLDQIDGHTFTVYLVLDDGDQDGVRHLMRAGRAMLRCGGMAVKVESSGVAHDAAAWIELAEIADLDSMLHAFVTYVGDGDLYYSCGMHHLGGRDAVVHAEIAPAEAALLLDSFLRYLIFEQPVMHDGETFGIATGTPRYRVSRGPCELFDEDDLFHNPYGIWQLVPA